MISYQVNDKMVNTLISCVGRIYEEISSKKFPTNKSLLEKSENVQVFIEAIRVRININLVIDPILSDAVPFAIVPFTNVSSKDINGAEEAGIGIGLGLMALNPIKLQARIDSILKDRNKEYAVYNNKKGYIDLKHARLGGYMSEVKHHLLINFFEAFKMEFTPAELVAVITHEVGHAFHGLEFHHKLETTNVTFLNIIEKINKKDYAKAEHMLVTTVGEKEFKEAILAKDGIIKDYREAVVLGYLSAIKSQLPSNKYDQTTFENLADEFATRFGLGKELVSGLNKIHSRYGVTYKRSLVLTSFQYFIEILTIGVIMFVGGYIGVAAYTALFFFILGDGKADMTYDFPLDRYNRIKNSLINQMKDTNLPNDFLAKLLADYKFIDGIIEGSQYFKSFGSTLADVVLASNRKNVYYMKLQKEVENSLNNELFVKFVELKTV